MKNNKTLKAVKCKDGWVVEITAHHICRTMTEVNKLCRRYDLIRKTKTYLPDELNGEPTKEVIKIFAEPKIIN